jgi:hypothetical protein
MSLNRKPKIIQSYVHNFFDDMGQEIKHFLPWGDDAEGENDGRWFFAMPWSSMKFLKLIMRYRTLANGFNMDLELGTIEEGQAVSRTSFNANTRHFATVSIPITSNSSFVIDRDDFGSNTTFTQNVDATEIKMLAISIEADLDPGASNEWYMTSLWECQL